MRVALQQNLLGLLSRQRTPSEARNTPPMQPSLLFLDTNVQRWSGDAQFGQIAQATNEATTCQLDPSGCASLGDFSDYNKDEPSVLRPTSETSTTLQDTVSKPILTPNTVVIQLEEVEETEPTAEEPEDIRKTKRRCLSRHFLPLDLHNLHYHGHSRCRLQTLQKLWTARQRQWQQYELDNTFTQDPSQAYDGIMRIPPPEPFHPWWHSETAKSLSSASAANPSMPLNPNLFPRTGDLLHVHDPRAVALDRILGDVPLYSITKALFLSDLQQCFDKKGFASSGSVDNVTCINDDIDEDTLVADFSMCTIALDESVTISSNAKGKAAQNKMNPFSTLDTSWPARHRTLLRIFNRSEFAHLAVDDFLMDVGLNLRSMHVDDNACVVGLERPRSPKFFIQDDDDDDIFTMHENEQPYLSRAGDYCCAAGPSAFAYGYPGEWRSASSSDFSDSILV